MSSHYTRLQVTCDPDFTEILIAEIAETGFDMFMETEKGFEAHTEEKRVDQKALDQIREKYKDVQPLLFFQDKVKKQNWNEEWEKNVDPIVVEDQCLIRASFHKIEKKYPYEIIITPKMSFGTGHHPTTHLMVKGQLKIDHQKKRVMDAGCGTAILSVMASKSGADCIEAFDIDEWSIENGVENARLNDCQNITIRRGTIREFKWPVSFDIILANINKNVLLDEMEVYAKNLLPQGTLLVSGFYVSDIPDLRKAAGRVGFAYVGQDERESWASVTFQKNG